jgi:hypothetical protein
MENDGRAMRPTPVGDTAVLLKLTNDYKDTIDDLEKKLIDIHMATLRLGANETPSPTECCKKQPDIPEGTIYYYFEEELERLRTQASRAGTILRSLTMLV